MDKILEKIYVIQPVLDNGKNYQTLYREACSLIISAGAENCGTTFQHIREINPATFIGSGKVAEIAEILNGLSADLGDITILFNGELSPSQTLNLSAAFGDRKVIDRTTLILDIFAQNAVSSEGKIQVELAQLKYIYPRLKGKGAGLSRLGGGIGSRGPGETQLETDRRHIRYRIKFLENKLQETETRRSLQTKRRKKEDVNIVALVGYTNTGKSTLMNLLTGSDVLMKDALFATLDPTARKFEIDGVEYVLVDTVGFLQELPTSIIEAFKSTLESALNCDLALLVSDANDDYNMQFETTLNTLGELGFNKPYIKVLNKCEYLTDRSGFPKDCLYISAKENLGIDELKRAIADQFKNRFLVCNLFIPYAKLSEYSSIARFVTERKREFSDNGLEIEGLIRNEKLSLFEDYLK